MVRDRHRDLDRFAAGDRDAVELIEEQPIHQLGVLDRIDRGVNLRGDQLPSRSGDVNELRLRASERTAIRVLRWSARSPGHRGGYKATSSTEASVKKA